jgi:site-specific DNA-methyltransferase (adenine-specific)
MIHVTQQNSAGKLKFHPITSVFSLLSDEDLAELSEDIRANGQRVPILVKDGRIIDGRNRYLACRKTGIRPVIEEWKGTGSLVDLVLSLNLRRRHLSASQRAMIAAELKPFYEQEARKRQREEGAKQACRGREGGRGHKKPLQARLPGGVLVRKTTSQSRDLAAARVSVGGRSVDLAVQVKRADPELACRVRAGAMTLHQAGVEVRRREKRAQLQQAAEQAQGASGSERRWHILNVDCLQGLSASALNKSGFARPRLIFADPPYNIGVDYGAGAKRDLLPRDAFIAWCRRWTSASFKLLTPDGSLWVMINHENAARLELALEDAGFTIVNWITWYETFGVNCSRRFNRTSRCILHAVKDLNNYVFNEDAVTGPSARQRVYQDSRAAPGGKLWDDVWTIPRLSGTARERIPGFPTQLPLELLRAVVGCASLPGDAVIDPFCGSATTGAACVEQGRTFLGMDLNPEYVALAAARLAKVSVVK